MAYYPPPSSNSPEEHFFEKCNLCDSCMILEQNLGALQHTLEWHILHYQQKHTEEEQAKLNYNAKWAQLKEEVDRLTEEKLKKENLWKEAMQKLELGRKELAALETKTKNLNTEISCILSVNAGTKLSLEAELLAMEKEMQLNSKTATILEKKCLEFTNSVK